MTKKNNITISDAPLPDDPNVLKAKAEQANECINTIARAIGRDIAREHYREWEAEQRRQKRPPET